MEDSAEKEKLAKVSQDLIKMGRIDQSHRDDETYDPEIDKNNLIKLKEFMDQIGWPTISKVGKVASQAAWLIAQHATIDGGEKFDTPFQEKVLQMMEEAGNDVDPVARAYLRDRILVAKGQLQIYGTQSKKVAGEWVQFETIDPENLVDRRNEVGNFPIKIYPEIQI